ncbi:uncharacterized protein SOCE836_065040 [Sorangium cellulosum]|uniref:Uncharacterized protein n=1 Tax=Sorangium cellulosum TaxID=56 RepID=A0A4V0NGT9_SORCE|nr:uncharacterized protein SOCE836_065040 [Sorangium cellulosum]WCQ93650.1 hypothetical protein NQZ70_06402 [Sorangium sp. Soce836]
MRGPAGVREDGVREDGVREDGVREDEDRADARRAEKLARGAGVLVYARAACGRSARC